MATDLEAAAERLLNTDAHSEYWGSEQKFDDTNLLADFAAPLLDTEPITEEKLIALGGLRNTNIRMDGSLETTSVGLSNALTSYIQYRPGTPNLKATIHIDASFLADEVKLGILRGLCHFLGIKLKEPS